MASNTAVHDALVGAGFEHTGQEELPAGTFHSERFGRPSINYYSMPTALHGVPHMVNVYRVTYPHGPNPNDTAALNYEVTYAPNEGGSEYDVPRHSVTITPGAQGKFREESLVGDVLDHHKNVMKQMSEENKPSGRFRNVDITRDLLPSGNSVNSPRIFDSRVSAYSPRCTMCRSKNVFPTGDDNYQCDDCFNEFTGSEAKSDAEMEFPDIGGNVPKNYGKPKFYSATDSIFYRRDPEES